MNAFEIIGIACVDHKFRDELFNPTGALIEKNPDLTWSEREGLLRVTGGDEDNKTELKTKMDEVGEILKRCANPPCPWPKAFTVNPMVLEEKHSV